LTNLTHYTTGNLMIAACSDNILMRFILVIKCNDLELFIGAIGAGNDGFLDTIFNLKIRTDLTVMLGSG